MPFSARNEHAGAYGAIPPDFAGKTARLVIAALMGVKSVKCRQVVEVEVIGIIDLYWTLGESS